MPQTKFKCPLSDEEYDFGHCIKKCEGICEHGNLLFLAAMIPNERKVIKDQWSTTQLIAPPQITVFKQRYDYADYPQAGMFATWGSAWHVLMERGIHVLAEMGVDISDFVIEKPFSVKIQIPLGEVILTGIPDLYIKSRYDQWDWKTTKAYVIGKKWEEQEEWFWQANIYKQFANPEAKTLFVGGAIRDFGWDTFARDGLTEFVTRDVSQYPKEVVMDFIVERLTLLKRCQDEEIDPPYCTDRERWLGWDRTIKQNVYRRCERYCPVNIYCPQYQEYKNGQTEGL